MIVVHGLFAEQHEPRVFAARKRKQGPGDEQRLGARGRVDADRAIGSERKAGAKLALRLGRPQRDQNHLRECARFSKAQRGLERNLVERVDARLEPFGRHPRAVGFHPHADVVIDDPLDPHHHRLQLAGSGLPT